MDGADFVVLSGGDLGTVVSSSTGGLLWTLTDLTLTEGLATEIPAFATDSSAYGGGLLCDAASEVLLDGVVFTANVGEVGAGLASSCEVLSEDTSWTHNTASIAGGGAYLRNASASFSGGSFTDNTATIAGGGMFLDGRYNNNNVDVSAMDWTGNRASSGGAIWADIDNYGYIRGSGVHFDDNLVGDVTVGYSVGGTDYTTHTISGSTISCNRYGC